MTALEPTGLAFGSARTTVATTETAIDALAAALDRDGCVALPSLVPAATLAAMQKAFDNRLRYRRWNNVDGYYRQELMRLMVDDVLMLEQGFVDIGLSPIVKGVLDRYLGTSYGLCEAKGWETLRAEKDFHGWHGDAWYDQATIKDRIPREVKLAFYLTEVKSGAFQYIRGSHRQAAPFSLKRTDVDNLPLERMSEFKGVAGSAVLFDTSGIHRQGVPVLEPRRAVFYNYHDVGVALQTEDVDYYRYHPLYLNAAFLGDLSPRDQQILGFGVKTRFQPDFVRKPSHPLTHKLMTGIHAAELHANYWSSRIGGRLKRLLAARG